MMIRSRLFPSIPTRCKAALVEQSTTFDPPRRWLRLLGWAVLLLGLPLAFLGALMPANEYQATFGIQALDCDGPFKIYIFIVPALLIYGAGLIVNGWRWRSRTSLIVALLCFAICIGLVAQVTEAVAVSHKHQAACSGR